MRQRRPTRILLKPAGRRCYAKSRRVASRLSHFPGKDGGVCRRGILKHRIQSPRSLSPSARAIGCWVFDDFGEAVFRQAFEEETTSFSLKIGRNIAMTMPPTM